MYKILSFLIFLFLMSCGNPEPVAIDYGKEQCHYCKMTIVDNQHAAEIVTKKRKAFKYDAIECMINDLKDEENQPIALYLVCDYAHPGELVDAKSSTYLISKEIPSPMGANLSAFSSKDKAEETQKEKTGNLYTWKELIEKFSSSK